MNQSFFFLQKKKRFEITCILITENFHEMSKPVSRENKKLDFKIVFADFHTACKALNPMTSCMSGCSRVDVEMTSCMSGCSRVDVEMTSCMSGCSRVDVEMTSCMRFRFPIYSGPSCSKHR